MTGGNITRVSMQWTEEIIARYDPARFAVGRIHTHIEDGVIVKMTREAGDNAWSVEILRQPGLTYTELADLIAGRREGENR